MPITEWNQSKDKKQGCSILILPAFAHRCGCGRLPLYHSITLPLSHSRSLSSALLVRHPRERGSMLLSLHFMYENIPAIQPLLLLECKRILCECTSSPAHRFLCYCGWELCAAPFHAFAMSSFSAQQCPHLDHIGILHGPPLPPGLPFCSLQHRNDSCWACSFVALSRKWMGQWAIFPFPAPVSRPYRCTSSWDKMQHIPHFCSKSGPDDVGACCLLSQLPKTLFGRIPISLKERVRENGIMGWVT